LNSCAVAVFANRINDDASEREQSVRALASFRTRHPHPCRLLDQGLEFVDILFGEPKQTSLGLFVVRQSIIVSRHAFSMPTLFALE
jgi:hypothetical protein